MRIVLVILSLLSLSLYAENIDIGFHGGFSFGYKNPTNPEEKLDMAPSVGLRITVDALKIFDIGIYATYTHLGRYPFTMKDLFEKYFSGDMGDYFKDYFNKFQDQSFYDQHKSQYDEYFKKYGYSYDQFKSQGFDGFEKYMQDRMAEMGTDTLLMVNYHEIGIGLDVRKRFPIATGVVQPFVGTGLNMHFQLSDDQLLLSIAESQATGSSPSFSTFKTHLNPGVHFFGGVLIKPPVAPIGFNVEYRENVQFRTDGTNVFGNLTGSFSIIF